MGLIECGKQCARWAVKNLSAKFESERVEWVLDVDKRAKLRRHQSKDQQPQQKEDYLLRSSAAWLHEL